MIFIKSMMSTPQLLCKSIEIFYPTIQKKARYEHPLHETVENNHRINSTVAQIQKKPIDYCESSINTKSISTPRDVKLNTPKSSNI